MDIPYPFAAYSVDMKHVKLHLDQKNWLANEVISTGISGYELGKRFNLDRRIINRYVRTIRSGVKLRETGGRPKILDSISVIELQNFVESNHTRDRDILRPYIRDERRETTKRKFLNVEEVPAEAYKKTGLRSMRRYQKILLPFNMNDTLRLM